MLCSLFINLLQLIKKNLSIPPEEVVAKNEKLLNKGKISTLAV